MSLVYIYQKVSSHINIEPKSNQCYSCIKYIIIFIQYLFLFNIGKPEQAGKPYSYPSHCRPCLTCREGEGGRKKLKTYLERKENFFDQRIKNTEQHKHR